MSQPLRGGAQGYYFGVRGGIMVHFTSVLPDCENLPITRQHTAHRDVIVRASESCCIKRLIHELCVECGVGHSCTLEVGPSGG